MSIAIEGLAPLLLVYDMPTSIRFYREIIGFELVSTSDEEEHYDWALLRLNGVELMLNAAYEVPDRPSRPDPDRVAYHVDTCIYFACRDVDAAYTHFLEKGLNVKPPRLAYS